jgi:hypothetical protein
MAQWIRLSATTGINLDQIVSWQDAPCWDARVCEDVPCVTLTTAATTLDMSGNPMPHIIQLREEERETFLTLVSVITPYYPPTATDVT